MIPVIKKNRLAYLDSIRAIATLMVFVQHVVLKLRRDGLMTEFMDYITFWTVDILDFGKIGVVLFFMLSGYLIPFSLKPGDKVKDFAIKRFFRLYPVFWFSILIGILFLDDVTLSLHTILANITMVPEMLGQKSIIGVYWTLQIELIFYFCCALLFILNILRNFKYIHLISIGFVLVALAASIFRYYLDIKLPIALPLALGLMFYGYIWREEGKSKSSSSLISKQNIFFSSFFVICMLLISFLAYNRNYGFNEVWYRYFLSYFLAYMLFLLFTRKIKLENGMLSFVAKISYSLYLFHVVAIHIIGQITFVNTIIDNILFIFLSLALSIVISALTYYLIEEKFVVMGRKIVKRTES